MPTPNKDETQDDFLERCMGDAKAVADFPDNDQRYAFCVSQWSSRSTKAMKISDILEKADKKKKPVKKVSELLHKATDDGPERIVADYTITQRNDEKQIVVGQVYAPDTLDSHGHYMTASELEAVAHGFLAEGLTASIDIQHGNVLVDATIVESFIARKDDPDFEEGAWVAATKINDPLVWQKVKSGEINGYSFEILTFKSDTEVEIEFNSWYYGFTDPDPRDNHTHAFIVHLDDSGELVYGQTSLGSDGSAAHSISKSNVTDKAAGHRHRVHFKE